MSPDYPYPIILSHIQVGALSAARQAGHATAITSPDLGLSQVEVALEPEGVRFPGGQSLSWEQIAEIAAHETTCFVLEETTLRKAQAYSDEFDRFYSLMPTTGAPTVLIAGFPMHRIKGIDPRQDTLKKIRALGSLRGRVLDTTTGLGYTAIEAAKGATQVVTIELDLTTLELARLNPWSRALFHSPNIQQIIGDAFDVVPTLDDAAFSRIIHDPPTFQLAGELYSGAFYAQLLRVLRPGGRLFHYLGDLESKAGSSVARGVVRRLQAAGFERIVRRPEAFGVVAYK